MTDFLIEQHLWIRCDVLIFLEEYLPPDILKKSCKFLVGNNHLSPRYHHLKHYFLTKTIFHSNSRWTFCISHLPTLPTPKFHLNSSRFSRKIVNKRECNGNWHIPVRLFFIIRKFQLFWVNISSPCLIGNVRASQVHSTPWPPLLLTIQCKIVVGSVIWTIQLFIHL